MAVLALACLAIGFLAFLVGSRIGDPDRMPGPKRWPLIGNLHLLRGYKIPYRAFADLSKRFGQVYSLRLGNVEAVAVHGLENIREVLLRKSHHFDSRPNFKRYHQLFHGNKENSLAFCDWSDVQKKRRDLLKDHAFPKVYSNSYQQLNQLICEEVNKLIEGIADSANNNNNNNSKSNKICASDSDRIGTKKTIFDGAKNRFGNHFKNLSTLIESKHVESIFKFPRNLNPEPIFVQPENPIEGIKHRVLATCANIFLRYFCSAECPPKENPSGFRDFVEDFDRIFYEINQGYACDFLPFLGIFRRKNLDSVLDRSRNIRKYVLENLVKDRLEETEVDSVPADYVDALLKSVKREIFDMETALFSLEDIIGGHSAIGNFLVKLLAFLVNEKAVQAKIREEFGRRGKDFVTLEDRLHMPYTEAVIMEALRMLSSPIVPHVSNRDTTIAGYKVKKDTLVFLNNYELNVSESLWTDPARFDPTRFIDPRTGTKSNPAHFRPFGGGKRSCMGYKLVQFVSFVFLANLVNRFEICPVPGEKYEDVGIGNLALPTQTFRFDFRMR